MAIIRSTVRRILRAAWVAAVRKRRAAKHRARRDRKPQAGLWDGSRHDWLGGRGPTLTLIGALEDATNELLPGAHFVEQECTTAHLRVLDANVRDKGVPWSSYGDRHRIFRRSDDHWTLEEELRGKQDPTQLRSHARGAGHRAHRRALVAGQRARGLATASSTELGELRARKNNRKRPAGSRAFRAAVERAASPNVDSGSRTAGARP